MLLTEENNEKLRVQDDKVNDMIKHNEELKEQLIKYKVMETELHMKIEQLEYQNKLKSAEEVRLKGEKKYKEYKMKKKEDLLKLGN